MYTMSKNIMNKFIKFTGNWTFENLYILKFLLIFTEPKIFMAESRILNILMLFAVYVL